MSLSTSGIIRNKLRLLIGCGEYNQTRLNSTLREREPCMQRLRHASARPMQAAKTQITCSRKVSQFIYKQTAFM
jgi:hypothetical protein